MIYTFLWLLKKDLLRQIQQRPHLVMEGHLRFTSNPEDEFRGNHDIVILTNDI